jgi:hypothetical protein
MPSKTRSTSHRHIETYRELETFVDAFARGCLNLVIVCGRAGVGKSSAVRKRVGPQAKMLHGTATPFGIYVAAYQHRDDLIVLDDVDGLTASPQGVRLLKSLTQTDAVKTVSWESEAGALRRLQIPKSFETRSHVAILANSLSSSNDAGALEDRGHVLEFAPSASEVHRQASNWFRDQEVFDFIATHLHLMPCHSLRTYTKASELKRAGLPWQSAVLEQCLSGKALEVEKLLCDPRFQSEEDRARAFTERGLGCRSTFYNYVRRLRALQTQQAEPRIVLPKAPVQLELKLSA